MTGINPRRKIKNITPEGQTPHKWAVGTFTFTVTATDDQTPHKWAVGHTTFEFSFSLPEPANSGNCSKTKKKQPVPPPRTSTASTRPRESPAKARKLKLHTKPDSASVETKKQDRAEYERRRNQTPERKEQARLLAQSRQRKAKELGKCRNCIQPAILGQTRCETCAENHRQSRRRSDAERRAMAKETGTIERFTKCYNPARGHIAPCRTDQRK